MAIISDHQSALCLLGACRVTLLARLKKDSMTGIMPLQSERLLVQRLNEYLETPRIARDLMEAVEQFEARQGSA